MIKILAQAIHHTLEFGDFNIIIVKGEDDKEHVILVKGDIEGHKDVLCRISSECLPGTALYSAECDCKQQIQYALKVIAEEKNGIFIYLRQEGRGHGLATKIRALANKNKGLDTFEAVEALGLAADVREYSIVKDILDFYDVKSIRCLCNSPEKIQALQNENICISEVVNIPIVANVFSFRHLQAKQNKGHVIHFTDMIN